MRSAVSDDVAAGVARAAYTVATAGGSLPLSDADRRAIRSAVRTVFGRPSEVDLAQLTAVDSVDLVRLVDDRAMRLDLVRVLAVIALLDGAVEQPKLSLVLDFASSRHVHGEFVDAIAQLSLNHVRWVAYGTFGRAFHEHYATNRYEFPGHELALAEAWATAHDSLHVLSGYSTSAQGELLVATFTGGQLAPGTDFMESHTLPTILICHLGIDINKGLNAGDQARIAADPSWRDNYDGNVHLGLDAEKLWVAWQRGQAMNTNAYDGHWDFWAIVDRPLDELRQEYGIPPLDPALAAVAEADVQRGDFERLGVAPPPPISSVPITDHPPVAPARR